MLRKITGDEDILEAKFNTRSNHEFHKISDEISQEIGLPNEATGFFLLGNNG